MAAGVNDPPEPPPASRIEIVETGPPLVLHLLHLRPGGPLSRKVFWFACVWWIVAAVPTLGVAASVLRPGEANWAAVPFLASFPAVAVCLTLWWSWLRHARTLVFAEPGCVSVRRRWLGLTFDRSANLRPEDRAASVRDSIDDDSPHFVRIRSSRDATLTFGSRLSEAETRWVAGAINDVLREPRIGTDADRPAPTIPA